MIACTKPGRLQVTYTNNCKLKFHCFAQKPTICCNYIYNQLRSQYLKVLNTNTWVSVRTAIPSVTYISHDCLHCLHCQSFVNFPSVCANIGLQKNQFLCCYTFRHNGAQGSNQYSNIQTDIGFIFIQILPIIHLLFEVVFIGQITLNLARVLSIIIPH